MLCPIAQASAEVTVQWLSGYFQTSSAAPRSRFYRLWLPGSKTSPLGARPLISASPHRRAPRGRRALRTYDDKVEKARKAAYDAARTNVARIADSRGGHVWWSDKKNYSDATDAIAKDITGQDVSDLLSFDSRCGESKRTDYHYNAQRLPLGDTDGVLSGRSLTRAESGLPRR